MVAIGVVDQAQFDVWLAEPSGAGVPFRQEDLHDLVRMRGLDIAQHVPGWGTPLNRDAYNRMFPEGKRTLGKFERTPIDQEILRHAQMGAAIYQDSIAADIAEMRSRSRAEVPAPSPPAPLPPSEQTIKYIDDPEATVRAPS